MDFTAIYQLIDEGANNLSDIVRAISSTEITRGYARDVIKHGIELEDFYGDVEEIFSITPSGEEILRKAPLPADWGEYEYLFYTSAKQETPDGDTSGVISEDAASVFL